jgi:glucose-1-phosphate cytidylyltransferase
MKTVILAGGFGTRISEESHLVPKPMIEIGGQPILWHILKSYSHYGYNDFIICCGYKAEVIKQYFANYYMLRSDTTFDFCKGNKITIHSNVAEPWRVTVVDTGFSTMTGGRVKRIQPYVGDETFMLTYGDGVCDLDMSKLVAFHKARGKTATLTAIQPGGKFGVLDIRGDQTIHSFTEKKKEDGGWINGGFMVLEPAIFNLIEGDHTTLEKEPLEGLAEKGELNAYQYDGFWQCMDTLRDKTLLDNLLEQGKAPWKVWAE